MQGKLGPAFPKIGGRGLSRCGAELYIWSRHSLLGPYIKQRTTKENRLSQRTADLL
jgi:hypothetical protein